MKQESITYIHNLLHERANETTASVNNATWRVKYYEDLISRATPEAKTRATEALLALQTAQKGYDDAKTEAFAVLREFEAEHSLEPVVEDEE